jgi:hypothetical protein
MSIPALNAPHDKENLMSKPLLAAAALLTAYANRKKLASLFEKKFGSASSTSTPTRPWSEQVKDGVRHAARTADHALDRAADTASQWKDQAQQALRQGADRADAALDRAQVKTQQMGDKVVNLKNQAEQKTADMNAQALEKARQTAAAASHSLDKAGHAATDAAHALRGKADALHEKADASREKSHGATPPMGAAAPAPSTPAAERAAS